MKLFSIFYKIINAKYILNFIDFLLYNTKLYFIDDKVIGIDEYIENNINHFLPKSEWGNASLLL